MAKNTSNRRNIPKHSKKKGKKKSTVPRAQVFKFCMNALEVLAYVLRLAERISKIWD